MPQLDENSVGKYFTKGDDTETVYRCISYCQEPTVTFENIETKHREGGAVSSRVAAEFKPIKGKYHKGIYIKDVSTLVFCVQQERMFFWHDKILNHSFIIGMHFATVLNGINNRRLRLAEPNE